MPAGVACAALPPNSRAGGAGIIRLTSNFHEGRLW
jgi:hypothetical protein